jgi:hypothetical protein
MSRRKQEKRERKARQKRLERRQQQAPLAYTGRKYHTEALVPLHLATETAIFAADLTSDGDLTDRQVRHAVERLILDIRRGAPPAPSEPPGEMVYRQGEEEKLVVDHIRARYFDLFRTEPDPGRDAMVGVLRSLLASIDAHSSINSQSRGYLEFLEDFLAQAGVRVEVEDVPYEPEQSRWEPWAI